MIEGSGIDIIEIGRIKEACEKQKERFINKVFTQKEIDYSFSRRFPHQHLAARFAAKEATLKAFGNGWERFSLKLIEISNDKDGKPQVTLKGNLKKLYQKRKITEVAVSMSHSKKFAVASCILIKNGKA